MTTRARVVEAAILDLLRRREAGRSACPSDVARTLAAREEREDWRASMEEVRVAAASLADRGLVTVTQKGKPVDARTVRGPIRLRLP